MHRLLASLFIKNWKNHLSIHSHHPNGIFFWWEASLNTSLLTSKKLVRLNCSHGNFICLHPRLNQKFTNYFSFLQACNRGHGCKVLLFKLSGFLRLFPPSVITCLVLAWRVRCSSWGKISGGFQNVCESRKPVTSSDKHAKSIEHCYTSVYNRKRPASSTVSVSVLN